jgi:phosphoribosyl 1,2-cyclic phosphodiesterase
MRVTCLASGSSGNCLLVQTDSTAILLDAGVGVRTVRRELAERGVGDHQLSAILITHEHEDHIRALPSIVRYQRAAVYATDGTIHCLRPRLTAEFERVEPEMALVVGDLTITAVRVSHDAAEPVGFVMHDAETTVAVFTDLGEVNGDVAVAVADAELVVLESNYDEQMLARGPYPAHLKQRIRGARGHLGNGECADFLARCLTTTTGEVWLAHLSQNNNRPALAQAASRSRLGPSGPRVRTLPRHGAIVSWDSREAVKRPRQLNLF